ncbi:MAG: DUF3846 domain-containing protein [Abditibacteriota bacterium]|nr:DUF3846 domain-containing protein [Abditibacteriota bacterium]
MTDKNEEPEEIAALVAEPGRTVRVRKIVPTVEAMREIVGGNLKEISPYTEPVALIYNGGGDSRGLPGNILLKNGSGQPYAVIHGTFLALGVHDGVYVSLTEEQIWRLRKLFLRDRLPCGRQLRPEADGTMEQAACGENRWRPVVLTAGKSISPSFTAVRLSAHRKSVP